MPVNCIRCKSMIPQADITARMTAKDKEGNFFCARCTVDLASQMGVKLGGPRGTQPPAGMPGQTVILSRSSLGRPAPPPQRPGSSGRVETATHPGSARPGSGTVARPGSGPVPRPGTGVVPRVGTSPGTRRIGTGSGPVPRVGTSPGTGRVGTGSGPVPRVGAPPHTGSSPRIGTAAPGQPGSSPRVGRAMTRPLPGTGRVMTTRRMPQPPPPDEPMEEGDLVDEGAPPSPLRRLSPKMFLLLSVVAVVVIAAVFIFVVRQKSGEEQERANRNRAAEKALVELNSAIQERPREYERHLELARAFAEKAQGVPKYATAGPERVKQAEEAISKDKTARQAASELAALEKDADDPANAERLQKDIDRIRPRLDLTNPDVRGRFDMLQRKVGGFLVLGIFNEAKVIAEKEPNSHDAILAKLGEAYAAAAKAGDGTDYLKKDILEEDDRIANLKYTADFEAKVDWIDLLSGDWKGQWKKNPSATSVPPGPETIDAQTGGPEWILSCKEATGVFYTGADKGWRDFIAELEVKIEKRGFGFFGRCGRSENVVRYDVEAKPNSGIEEGATYKVRIAIKGLQEKAAISEVGSEDIKIRHTMALSGGVGLTLEPGAKITLKSFKVKILRAETK